MHYRYRVFFSTAGLFSLLNAISLHAEGEVPAGIQFTPALQATSGTSENLRIRQSSVATEQDARKEFRERVQLFERYLAKQIDPYTGESTAESHCKKAKTIEKRPGQLSQSIVLQVSSALAVDCYGTGQDRKVDHKQLLYCAKSKTIFEIDYYHDAKENPQVPVAACR